jgi:signal transduction histidine kinase
VWSDEHERLVAACLREIDSACERRALSAARTEVTFATFARRAAHDMNNYLGAITAFASAAKRERIDDEDATAILHAAGQAATLCAYLTKATQRTLPALHDVNVLLVHVQPLIQTLLGESTTIRWDLAAKALMIRVCPLELEQILINLALNARDASSRKLTVSTASREIVSDDPSAWQPPPPAGVYAEIAVTDDGKGMDSDTRDRIFEPFFTTKGKAGTGLGMATVHILVNDLRGSIRIESALGRGTTVRVLVPTVPRRRSNVTPVPNNESTL